MKMNKKIKENSMNKNKKNAGVIIVLGCVLAIIAIVIVVNVMSKQAMYKKYSHYEDKMYSYGFNKLYNNESAKTSQKVTKSEAMKMAIGVCLNTYDISGIAKVPTTEYPNAIWVLYAQDAKLATATELNEDTANKKVEYVDVIKYFANTKKELLNKKLAKTSKKEVIDLEKYDYDYQVAITDLLANDILKVVDGKLNGNKEIFKGQLNEIVINYIEKYNLLGDKIQTDIAKLPSNASEFAYISENVDKSIYETPFEVNVKEDTKISKETYFEMKNFYDQMIQKTEDYYNLLLNVDYNTITAEDLKSGLKRLTTIKMSNEEISQYVEYLKNNQIKITGNAKVQKPIIYYDGMSYRLRTKLIFNVVSSTTMDNLLLGDLVSGATIRYQNKENDILIDAIFGQTLDLDTYYLEHTSLDSIIVGDKAETIKRVTE